MNQVSRFFLLFLSCFVASICEARRDTQRKQSGTPTRWGSVAGGFCLFLSSMEILFADTPAVPTRPAISSSTEQAPAADNRGGAEAPQSSGVEINRPSVPWPVSLALAGRTDNRRVRAEPRRIGQASSLIPGQDGAGIGGFGWIQTLVTDLRQGEVFQVGSIHDASVQFWIDEVTQDRPGVAETESNAFTVWFGLRF